jgi:hypothetical protein
MATAFDVTVFSPNSGREYQINVWSGRYLNVDLSVYWIKSRSWFSINRKRVYYKNFDYTIDAVKAAEQLVKELNTNPIFNCAQNENTTPSHS